MMTKPHVWRYDTTMPATERPWIVSQPGHDAEDFETWAEAFRWAYDKVIAISEDGDRGDIK